MQYEAWIGPAALAVFALFFIVLMGLFVRRQRQRRRELHDPEVITAVSAPEATELDAEPIVAPEPVELEATEVESAVTEVSEPALVAQPESQAVPEPVPEPVVDSRWRQGLGRTQASLLGRLSGLFKSTAAVDNDFLEQVEDILLGADLGVQLSTDFIDAMRAEVRTTGVQDPETIKAALKDKILQVLLLAKSTTDPLSLDEQQSGKAPRVILFVGVNGVGKTTSIGKIAAKLKGGGQNVVLGAGDTFRAAAVEQLKIWGERTDCRVIDAPMGTDPASVIFNTVQHGVQAKADFVLADTAGRLHTKSELMDEIQKVHRAAGKASAGAPHETWLVVDATTGQNALHQARQFHEMIGLTGLVLTKLDGTAKGGVVVAIADALQLPVHFIGVGEKAEDLLPFEPHGFVQALFDEGSVEDVMGA